ncbi:MAG: PD-(D/E)XK nuclease-like domain-containing protein [Clostridia bacterium]|nr:PD-(D/E)XK nuclease-like domain-containing protein [Clostridia bacterium]
MKLTARNYFSRKAAKEYMSVSQFKSFTRCQACAMAEIQGKYEREDTKALLVGSYVDAHFEGTLEKFKQLYPEIFKRDGTLKAEYIQAEAIIKRIERDKLFTQYMSGTKQVIMTGEICGVPVKIKVDSLHPDKIVDLKIVRDFENLYDAEKGSLPWFEFWEYDLQGAVYQEIVRQNTGKTLPFYLAAATKEKTTDIEIVHLNPKSLDFAFDRFKANVELYDAIKKGIIPPERCNKCEWCKETKVLTEPRDSEEYYLL